MRVVIQRVEKASVEVDNKTVGRIEKGLLILLGICNGDTDNDARDLADKCVNLRIFSDASGKFNHSVMDVAGEILVVSQFTLYGDTRKGRRPSFIAAAPPEVSKPLYERFVTAIRQSGLKTETGIFGAMMKVELVNDGPVTIIAEKGTPLS